MYNTNFGINFVLYCVSGQNFRRALVEFWRKTRYPNKRLRDTQVTTGAHYLGQKTYAIQLSLHLYIYTIK